MPAQSRLKDEATAKDFPVVTDPAKDTIIWQIYAAHTDYAKHFNTIQNTYRTFASTWIVAAFAGIISTTSKPDMVGWICVLSILAMGIFQSLDLRYHILLRSVLKRQEEIELKHNALIPDTVQQMRADLKGATFAFNINIFYIGSMVIFGILAIVGFTGSMPN